MYGCTVAYAGQVSFYEVPEITAMLIYRVVQCTLYNGVIFLYDADPDQNSYLVKKNYDKFEAIFYMYYT